METKALDTQQLARELAGAMPLLTAREQRVAIALYRLLAEGRPVAPERLAERTGIHDQEVRRLLEGWPGVYLDQAGVVGFWGLALDQMPHRLHLDGRELRAWCAWDTLFLPELIGRPATAESTCPTTGETVSLEVVPGSGVHDVSPAGAVLSFLRREQPFDADTIISFCHLVHFFASEEASADWTAKHPGTFLLSVRDGFEIGRLTNRARFAAALERSGR
ncbi:MAG: organomercurial lyase [Thermoleophilaceae bacterium]